jgi:hypothetical protein
LLYKGPIRVRGCRTTFDLYSFDSIEEIWVALGGG